MDSLDNVLFCSCCLFSGFGFCFLLLLLFLAQYCFSVFVSIKFVSMLLCVPVLHLFSQMNKALVCDYARRYLCSLLLVFIRVQFVLLGQASTDWLFPRSPDIHVYEILQGVYLPERGCAGTKGLCIFNVTRQGQLFFQRDLTSLHPLEKFKSLPCFLSLLKLITIRHLNFCPSDDGHLIMFLTFISQFTNEIARVFLHH